MSEKREHVKKLAFLAGNSAKASTPPPCKRSNSDLCKFFMRHVSMFLKPANSEMENGVTKKVEKCPLKKIINSGNWTLF